MVLHFEAKGAATDSAIDVAPGSIIGDVDNNPLGVTMNGDTMDVTAPDYYDLVISAKSERVEIESGDTVFYVDYTVANIGSLDVPENFSCAVLVNGSVEDVTDFSALAASATVDATAGPFPIPGGSSATITVVADYYNNNHKESDETNNELTNTLNLELPDYIVAEKYEEETAPGSYTLTYTIKNIGAGDVAVDSTTTIEVDGTLVDSQNCPALAAGASNTVIVTGLSLSSINDVVTVIADANNDIVESNEGNNDRSNTYSPSNVSNGTQIIADVEAQIILTCPADILDFHLEIGDNTISGVLNIKSNAAYQVEVSDEDPLTYGHMTEWNGVAYGSAKLTNPMIVSSSQYDVPLPSPGLLLTGTTVGQYLDDGQDFDIDFYQIVYFSDQVTVYRIVVSFTAGVTF